MPHVGLPVLISFVCSAIRKLCPKVERLDGHVLPAPITFDVDTPTTLPTPRDSHFMNDQCKDIICRFVNWYYAIYDGDNRQPLMEVYHPEVMFSLSTYNSRPMSRSTNWVDYQSNDRNLKSIRDASKRQTHLKRGQLDVVSLLTKLPASQHSPASFLVDVNTVTSCMLTFTIHGVYKERASKIHNKPVRKFARTFVTVPNSNEPGLTIINEMFNLAVASPAAGEKYFSATAPETSAPVSCGLTEQQLQMVQQFSAQSGMNPEWSTRCLSENSWNYEQAAKVFMEVNAKQGIPPEAFIRS